MRDHQQIKQLISIYFDGAATPDEEDIVLEHLKECDECQKYWQQLKSISSSLKSLPQQDLSPDCEQKIKKQMQDVQDREETEMKKSSIGLGVGVGVVTFVVCLMIMHQYTQRNLQARIRSGSHEIRQQLAATRDELKKYEPYYLESNYAVKGEPLPPAGEHQEYVDRRMKEIYAKALKDKNNASRQQIALGKTEESKKFIDVFRGSAVLDEEARGDALYGAKAGGGYRPSDYVNTEGLVGLPETTASISQPTETFMGGVSRQDLGIAANGLVVTKRPYWGEEDESIAWYPMPYPQKTEESNTESYDRIYENPFKMALDEALSTFSIDVDTASYSNVRRFLNQGKLPPKDSVRIEEMINYFVYNYPQPRGREPFSINTEIAACPWNPNHQLALIGLQGRQLNANEIAPSNLVFLIDVSGSMNQPNKLPLLKQAFHMMVSQLQPNERISIVTYAGSAGLVLDSTPASNRQAIHAAIDRMQAGGSTAGGQGIKLAYDVAQRNFIHNGNNRVILATDGDFNVGVSSDAAMVRLIEEKRNAGIFLTVLGFGTGNYKDSKMEKIADKGNGNYYYIDTENEARKVLVHELGSLLFTIAKDVKLQIEFNPSQIKAYRLIGYENRVMAKEDFNDDTKDAGELGAGHTVTALYEIVPANSSEQFGNVDPLKYQQQRVARSDDLMTVKLRYKESKGIKSKLITRTVKPRDVHLGQVSDNLAWAASVAEFGLLLRDSQYKANANYDTLLSRARQARGQDAWGYRSEFINLVETAKRLQVPSYYQRPAYDDGGYYQEGYTPQPRPMFKGHQQ